MRGREEEEGGGEVGKKSTHKVMHSLCLPLQ